MRSHRHRPDRVAEKFQKFAKEAVPYQAREGAAWEEPPAFITQDEVDACLIKGGSFSDWRLDVYSYFISDKTDKTITVLIESYKVHPLYGKRVKYSKKYAAHDELNDAKVGDLVRIEECRPMSKTKKFRLVEIVEKAVII